MVRTVMILILSFFASLGFGVTFHIRGRENLVLAGLGGLVTRAVFLVTSACIPQRFVYMLISAFASSLYGELMARRKHMPAVCFIYPSLIPLIPGDLFHYMIASMISGNREAAQTNGINCIIALLGLSVGMMLSSTTIRSIRKGPVSTEDED